MGEHEAPLNEGEPALQARDTKRAQFITWLIADVRLSDGPTDEHTRYPPNVNLFALVLVGSAGTKWT